MVNIEKLKDELISRFSPIGIEKIVLFGSYANKKANEDSDVDLYVVSNDNYIPKNYDENMELYKKFSSKIYDIKEDIAIDLIVHTKKMYEKFIALNSSFSKEIQNGVKLYES